MSTYAELIFHLHAYNDLDNYVFTFIMNDKFFSYKCLVGKTYTVRLKIQLCSFGST